MNITVPKSWAELSDSQLYYIYSLLSDNLSSAQIKTYCLFKWSRLKLVHKIDGGYIVAVGKEKNRVSAYHIESIIHTLDWVDSLPEMPVRIKKIKGHNAVDSLFQSVPFESFICCDNLYQGYIETQNVGLLEEMAEYLYGAKLRLNQEEKISIFYWWCTLKTYFAKVFNNFFQPCTDDHALAKEPTSVRLRNAMNAMIRALTKGDVTKESEIFKLDTWRALTELDAQAKEYQEIKRNAK